MIRFILSRLLTLVITILAAVTIVFFAIRLVPGDPILAMRGEGTGLLSADVIAALREKHGLNDPLLVQYAKFMARLFTTGDLGESFVNRLSVTQNIATAWPYTFRLALSATALFVILGLPLGALADIRRGTLWDTGLMALAVTGVSLPYFFTGLFFMYVFAYRLGWFPVSGAETWRHMVLPAFSLGLISAAAVARFSRSAMLEVLHLDYVRTARAKGLREWIINYHHALRNALIPLVTITGLQFGLLMSGSIITESIFSWPGLGHVLVRSILQRDYQMVQGAIMLFAATITLINLLMDVLYAYLDPRIKYAQQDHRTRPIRPVAGAPASEVGSRRPVAPAESRHGPWRRAGRGSDPRRVLGPPARVAPAECPRYTQLAGSPPAEATGSEPTRSAGTSTPGWSTVPGMPWLSASRP